MIGHTNNGLIGLLGFLSEVDINVVLKIYNIKACDEKFFEVLALFPVLLFY